MKPYQLHIQTPHGSSQIEADNWDDLTLLVPAEIATIITSQTSLDPAVRLDAAARAVLKVYRKRCSRNKKTGLNESTVAKAGLELDVIKLYLQRFTIDQAVTWIKNTHDITTSNSALGRYWCELNSLAIHYFRDF